MEWISVKDRLPENNTPVLVCFDNRYDFGGGNDLTIGVYDALGVQVKKGEWYDEGSWNADYGYDEIAVTHWMPLPEKPKS